jgi:hypothetical protein
MDPGADPQGLAFRGAPWAAVAPFAEQLARATGPIGPSTGSEVAAPDRLGAAMLALLRSGHGEALAAVDGFVRRTCRRDEDWAVVGDVAALADHAIVAGGDPAVVPIMTSRAFEVIDERAPTDSTRGGTSGASCTICRKPLVRMIQVSSAALGRRQDLRVDFCAECIIVTVDPYAVQYDARGIPATYVSGPSVVADDESRCSEADLPAVTSIRLEPALPWRGRLSEGNYDRIGGAPTWLQSPSPPRCPGCARPMMFVAQTGHVPGGWAELALAFECSGCRIVSTTLQRG